MKIKLPKYVLATWRLHSIRNVSLVPCRSFKYSTLLVWTFAGCASVGVRNPAQTSADATIPKRIVVADFDSGQGVFNVNRSGDELAAFQAKTANALAAYLVADLNRSVAPAIRGSVPGRKAANVWLITGEFVRVNQGSRALRGFIGLGAGGTKMETRVRVYDLSGHSKQPVLAFETSGGSNAEPGAILGGTFGALPNALRNGGLRGVSDDTARTAREITAMVADYYAKRGGQPLRAGMKPKMLATR
jgi:Domain of unknown function (DUF4410)